MLIKELRKNSGMTQKEFSEAFEIPLDVVKSWESGRRSPSKWAEKLIAEKLISKNTDKTINITLKSKVVNFKDKYRFGDILTVPILGYVKDNYDSYELVFFNPKEKANYCPIANGTSKTGEKYGVFSIIDGSGIGAFFSEHAAIYENEEGE